MNTNTASHEDIISITCTTCKNQVPFQLQSFESDLPCISTCSHCGKTYGIESGTISRQISLFIDLCRQLKKSEEILGSASIAVSVGPHEVKVPFKILLTRLRSTLDLDIGGSKLAISYRTEPLKVAQSIGEGTAQAEDVENFPSTL